MFKYENYYQIWRHVKDENYYQIWKHVKVRWYSANNLQAINIYLLRTCTWISIYLYEHNEMSFCGLLNGTWSSKALQKNFAYPFLQCLQPLFICVSLHNDLNTSLCIDFLCGITGLFRISMILIQSILTFHFIPPEASS